MRHAWFGLALLLCVIGADYLIPWGANAGLPLLYVAPDLSHGQAASYLLLGFASRAIAYGLLAVVTLAIAWGCGLRPGRRRAIGWVGATTAASWIYWFLVDPSALPILLPAAWQAHFAPFLDRHLPVVADLYSGWGFVRHFWWLVGIHWLVLCAVAGFFLGPERARTHNASGLDSSPHRLPTTSSS